MKPIPVLLVTYNRLEYSKQALESICLNPGLPIELTIWDNASTDGTSEWLDFIEPRQHRNTVSLKIVRSPRNSGLAPAINQFFRDHADAPYVVKVDNDTVLPDNWLVGLMDAMLYIKMHEVRIGAVSGTCLRPNGLTFAEWVRTSMDTTSYKEHALHFNTYILGTGVLINMDMIRNRGLLFEKFPRSVDSGPDDPCLISGWTAYTREACEFEGWKFAFYSKVPVNLLNILTEHVLSDDYPEYDAEVQKVRDEGNAWWDSVGGLPGVRKYVAEHGGLEQLSQTVDFSRPVDFNALENKYNEMTVSGPDCIPQLCIPQILTEADHLEERSTLDFWLRRVKEHGTTRSTFLSTPQTRIAEFTERHLQFIRQYATGKCVLDAGCGWGRMSKTIASVSEAYIGVDFVPELIDKAQESFPELQFALQDVSKGLSFPDECFDVVVAVTCLSSWAAVFPQILYELKRVVRRDGVILFLEENFVRIDWKLESE